MAYKIVNYNGITHGIDADYPYDQIKDDPNGTRADVKSNGDIQQFLQVLMYNNGITPNSTPDNATNGYQTLQAIGKGNSVQAGEILKTLIGPSYDPTKVYVISGTPTRDIDGLVLYNGNLYYLVGKVGSACGGGLVFVVRQKLSQSGTPLTANGLLAAEVQCAASGSGWVNYDTLFRTYNVAVSDWVNVTSTNAGWAAYTPQLRYRKDISGRVSFQGAFRSTSASPATDVFQMPVGFRPSETTLYSIGAYNETTTSYFVTYLRVFNDGTVQILNSSTITAANFWYDMGSISYFVN